MSHGEIGLLELARLARGNWKLIGGLALLPGLVSFIWLAFLSPVSYAAVATLVAHNPPARHSLLRSADAYRSLLGSESILQETGARLVANGILTDDRRLVLGRNLTIGIGTDPGSFTQGLASSMFVLTLRAHDRDPEVAAAIANTWAEVFIDRDLRMNRSLLSRRQPVLDQQFVEIREQLEELGAERSVIEAEYARRRALVFEEHERREREAAGDWDRRIAVAERTTEGSIGDYQAKTRLLMEETLTRLAPAGPGSEGPLDHGAELREIVSVRAQLAATPRLLTVEEADGAETFGEPTTDDTAAGLSDDAPVRRELNPLYGRLERTVVELETALRLDAGPRLGEVSRVLEELDAIQLARAAGLAEILAESGLELRRLRRERSFAVGAVRRQRDHRLEDLERDKELELAEIQRRHRQLRDLEKKAQQERNTVLLAGLFEQLGRATLVSRAVPRRLPEPRRIPTAVAATVFLGGLLGLTIAIFRSGVRAPGAGR